MANTVWRINLKTSSAEGADPRLFCINRNILGVGWPVPELPSGARWEDYQSKARYLYEEQNNDKGWRSALKGLHAEMENEDLVWTRDMDGIYYLGQVVGEWRYVSGREYEKHDIANARDCLWECVGLADTVPGKVANGFRGRALRRISDLTAAKLSKLIYNERVGEDRYEVDAFQADLFSLLSADECEDLVALYLQLQRGYLVIPSTAKKSTVKYEFTLVHRHSGERATLQVKSGAEPLDRDKFAHLPVKQVFLFSAQNRYEGHQSSRVECLDPEEIRDFAQQNEPLLPERIALWIKRLAG